MDDNGELLVALTDLEIARAELAAAKTRIAELESEVRRMTAAAQQEYDWQKQRTDEFTGTLSNVVASSEAELILLRNQNAALSAHLERVRALADKWERQLSETRVRGSQKVCAQELRAALGEAE